MGLILFLFWFTGWFAIVMIAACFSLRPAWFTIAIFWPLALLAYVVKWVMFFAATLFAWILESMEDLWAMILGR